MFDILSTIIYGCVGMILMVVGTFLVDLFIPCHFPTEIKNKNMAVGYITAGISIGIGILLKSAIISPVVEVIEKRFMEDLGSTLLYFAIGVILCIVGYLLMNLFNTKYNLNKEIGEGNGAAGLMVMGMFIGLSIVISGAIY